MRHSVTDDDAESARALSAKEDATEADNDDKEAVNGSPVKSSLNRGMETADLSCVSVITVGFTASGGVAGGADSFRRIEMSGTMGVRAVSTCSTHLVMLPAVPYILVGDKSNGLLLPAYTAGWTTKLPASFEDWAARSDTSVTLTLEVV
jgi:hypothetical protein